MRAGSLVSKGRAVMRRVRVSAASGSLRREFAGLAAANSLTLDWARNRTQVNVFREVFRMREYAAYFPFYEDANILDVGAHFGYFALFASVNTGPGARIVAVEPSTVNFQCLQANVADCARTNIQAVRLAVSGENGHARLSVGHSAENSLAREGSTVIQAYEQVPTVTLGTLLEQVRMPQVDFLKMDCEGSEYDAFGAADQSVMERINVVSLEFHDRKSTQQNGNALVRFLLTSGFSIKAFRYSPTVRGLNFGRIVASRIH